MILFIQVALTFSSGANMLKRTVAKSLADGKVYESVPFTDSDQSTTKPAEHPVLSGDQRGVVERFDAARGFGFIKPDGSDNLAFVHFQDIEMEGFKHLDPGNSVAFTITGEPGGYVAKNVYRV